MEVIVKSVDESLDLAERLAKQITPGTVLRLEGDLGAGKTTFTKGLARGLGIDRVIKSPTYTLIKEYHQGRLPLYHIDLYRLDEDGVADLGLEEYFYGDGVTVIEWGSVAEAEMPKDCLMVNIKVLGEENHRNITFKANGSSHEDILTSIRS